MAAKSRPEVPPIPGEKVRFLPCELMQSSARSNHAVHEQHKVPYPELYLLRCCVLKSQTALAPERVVLFRLQRCVRVVFACLSQKVQLSTIHASLGQR